VAATVAEAGLWVDQASMAAAGVAASSTSVAAQSWASFSGWYDAAAVAAVSAELAALSQAGQETVAGLFTEYIAQITALLRDQGRVQIPRITVPRIRNGVPGSTVHGRVAYAFKDTFALTGDEDLAIERAVARGIRLIEDDLMLAARQAQVDAMGDLQVTRYRRILRPELSEEGPCGLCVVASDTLYKRATLLPLHGRCKCLTMPVIGDDDLPKKLNRADLDRIYDAAGNRRGLDREADLKRIRIQISEHGELGPILHAQDTNVDRRDQQPIDRDLAARRLAKLQEVLAGLRQEPPGEDRDAKITFQEGAIGRAEADAAGQGGQGGGSGDQGPPTAGGAEEPEDWFQQVPLAGASIEYPDYSRLTEDEKTWVSYYASLGHRQINEALAGNVPMTDELQEIVDTIRGALRKYRLPRATRLTRITELSDLGVTDLDDIESLVFQVRTEPRFMSTSVLENPTQVRPYRQPVILDIIAPEGTPALRIRDQLVEPGQEFEREVLIIDARVYDIVGVAFDPRRNRWRVRIVIREES